MSKVNSSNHADHESDCSSYSYSPDFKNYIDETLQQLFYIRLHPIEEQDSLQIKFPTGENLFRNEYKRMSLRRDRGILSKLTGNNKKSLFEWKILDKNKYEHSDGVLKELKVGSASKSSKTSKNKKPVRLQKVKGNLFEAVFNATLILGPDNKRFILESIALGSVFERDLLVGDFIKSIDGEIITTDNIDNVLRRIQTQKSFKIVAYECYKDEFESSQEEIKITKAIDVVMNKEKLFHLEAESHELIFSFNLIVKNEQTTEDSDDYTTIFSYPPKENNFLHKLKGSFLTISSIMKTSFGSPMLSVLKVHDTNFYITYTVRNEEKQFIFIGFNSNYTKLFDVSLLSSNLMKYFDFIYSDLITSSNFQHLLTACEMMKIQLLKDSKDVSKFEQVFPYSTHVPLPKEIVLRINDSLSELEAMDYRNWNEDLMELFGKFNVSGSCLFYKTSLISSHFSETEMENVELFLRQSCFKILYENCLVREIAMWQRIYPKDYQSYNLENDSTKNKVFLLVAAHGNLMMCVILEENSYNMNPEVETQSSNYLIYFLEEMDDILDHLKIVGIENLARIWINSSKRPQCKSFAEKGNEIGHESSGILKTLKEEDDESDHDSQIDSQKSSSGFDMTDFSDAIYKDFTDIIPQTITFGPNENVLYHFTQLDVTEGMIVTTVNNRNLKGKARVIVDIFRKGCIKIHNTLQNTIKFNYMLSKENSKIPHKSTSNLVSIKETGLTVQVKLDSGEIIEFWIIGRLFGRRELFVCYEASIPQNMVEIAFRIGLNCLELDFKKIARTKHISHKTRVMEDETAAINDNSNEVLTTILSKYKDIVDNISEDNFKPIKDAIESSTNKDLKIDAAFEVFKKKLCDRIQRTFLSNWNEIEINVALSQLEFAKMRTTDDKIKLRPTNLKVVEQSIPAVVKMLQNRKKILEYQIEFQNIKIESLVPMVEERRRNLKNQVAIREDILSLIASDNENMKIVEDEISDINNSLSYE